MPAVVHVRVIDVFFAQLIDGYGHPCAYAVTYLQSWTQSLTCPLRPMTGALGGQSRKLWCPQLQCSDQVNDVPVVQVVECTSCWKRVPTVQTVQKTGEIPQVLFLDMVVMPVVVQ